MIKTIFIKKTQRKTARKNHILCWKAQKERSLTWIIGYLCLLNMMKNYFTSGVFINLHSSNCIVKTWKIPTKKTSCSCSEIVSFWISRTVKRALRLIQKFHAKFYDDCKKKETLVRKTLLHEQENSLGKKKLSWRRRKKFFFHEKFLRCARQIGVSFIMCYDTFFCYS